LNKICKGRAFPTFVLDVQLVHGVVVYGNYSKTF
jgi:hypothetical protein